MVSSPQNGGYVSYQGDGGMGGALNGGRVEIFKEGGLIPWRTLSTSSMKWLTEQNLEPIVWTLHRRQIQNHLKHHIVPETVVLNLAYIVVYSTIGEYYCVLPYTFIARNWSCVTLHMCCKKLILSYMKYVLWATDLVLPYTCLVRNRSRLTLYINCEKLIVSYLYMYGKKLI